MLHELITRLEEHFPEKQIIVNLSFYGKLSDGHSERNHVFWLHVGELCERFRSFSDLDRYAEKLIKNRILSKAAGLPIKGDWDE